MLFSCAISKDNKDDNLIMASKAFQKETYIVEIKNSYSAFLQSEHEN